MIVGLACSWHIWSRPEALPWPVPSAWRPGPSARPVGLPLQLCDLQLHPLGFSGYVGKVAARTLKRHQLPLTGGIQAGLRDPEPDLA